MSPAPRKGFGGPQPNSGRPALVVPTKPVQVWLTQPQHVEFKDRGGSGWLQGAMNLLRADRPEAFVLLLIDSLVKKHGREWLAGLVEKIKERAAHELDHQK